MSKLVVNNLPYLNTLVIKQLEGRDFFIATKDSIVISIPTLTFLLTFLVKNGFLSVKILEGIIEEVKE